MIASKLQKKWFNVNIQALLLIFAFATSGLWSQNQPPQTQPANQTNEQRNRPSGVDGFDGNPWGATYKELKEKFVALASTNDVKDRLEIVADSPGREIVISRKGIIYRYVFYLKPQDAARATAKKEITRNEADPNDVENKEEDIRNTARFFFIESLFPLVKSNDLYDKLAEKYGERTSSTLKEDDNRGADVWQKANGFLVQWIEPYEKNAYTRNLYYISKAIKKEIEVDMQDFLYQKEIAAVNNLLP